MVRDRAGWWEGVSDGVHYLFTAAGLREALKGFDFARALKCLEFSGVLQPGQCGKSSRTKSIHSRKVRVYVINPSGEQELVKSTLSVTGQDGKEML